MSKEIIPFYNGTEIRKDAEGKVSLTDLWKASGKDRFYNPSEWLGQGGTEVLVETVAGILNTGVDRIIKTKRGKGGGTYAHPQIALAYAKYLSPELHYAVNQVFFERIEEEKNPDLILDRAAETYKKHGKSDGWIAERFTGKATRLIFTGVLKSHGVIGQGYRNCTNAIYTPIFGGDATHLRDKKNLPSKSNTRENMTELELATTRLSELLAANNIEKRNIRGNAACAAECLRTSTLISNSVTQSLKRA